MKPNPIPAVFIACALGLSTASAQPLPPIADDFNDNSKDATKWGPDFVTASAAGSLNEINQRLEYTGASTFSRDRQRPWILHHPGYGRNWEVVVSVTNSLVSSNGGNAGAGIQVSPHGDPDHFIWLDFFMFQDDGTARGFYSSLDDEFVGEEFSFAPVSTHAALRITFNGTSKVLTCYYDADGAANGYSWTLSGSYGINGGGGSTGNRTWGMAAGGAFQVSLYGFGRETAVSSGQLYHDDFRITEPPLDDWKRQYFGDPDSPLAADSEDSDKDGINNLQEFAFGLNPILPGVPVLVAGSGTSGLPAISKTGSGPSLKLRIEYVRREVSTNPGISYEPQFSNRMAVAGPDAWQAASASEAITSIDTEWERVVVEDHGPSGEPIRFGRVKVSGASGG